MKTYQFLFIAGLLAMILAEERGSTLAGFGGWVLLAAGLWSVISNKEKEV